MSNQYETSTQLLANHILKILPDNLRILEFTDPFMLYEVEDFKGDELGLSLTLAMATIALSLAKQEYKNQ